MGWHPVETVQSDSSPSVECFLGWGLGFSFIPPHTQRYWGVMSKYLKALIARGTSVAYLVEHTPRVLRLTAVTWVLDSFAARCPLWISPFISPALSVSLQVVSDRVEKGNFWRLPNVDAVSGFGEGGTVVQWIALSPSVWSLFESVCVCRFVSWLFFCISSYSHRSVVVPVKKPPPGSLSVNTVGTPTTSGAATASSTPNIFAAATATPKSMINTTGERWHTHALLTSDAIHAYIHVCVFTCTASVWC